MAKESIDRVVKMAIFDRCTIELNTNPETRFLLLQTLGIFCTNHATDLVVFAVAVGCVLALFGAVKGWKTKNFASKRPIQTQLVLDEK